MNLKSILLVCLVGTHFASFSASTELKVSQKICLKVNANIEALNEKLRAGYTVKQGEKYKAKLRKLKIHQQKCASKRLPKI